MKGLESSNFDNIIKKFIKKSLFTERQIEILQSSKNRSGAPPGTSRGAYYRQLGQSKDKLARFYHTLVLLYSLEVIHPDDLEILLKVAEQIHVIKGCDSIIQDEDDVINVVDEVVLRLVKV